MADLTGRELGHFRLMAPLGRGGMADVYRALDLTDATMLGGREVAIKVLRLDAQSGPDVQRRFEREARTLADLAHPHILPSLEMGESDGYAYLVMPLLRGGTLADRLDSQARPLSEIRKLTTQIGSALSYAHARGIVHRDVKPANILIDDDGDFWLADLGIASLIEDTLDLTTHHRALGTPRYMSPEQVLGEPVSEASDIYSLGVVLYEMATGRAPFEDPSPSTLAKLHLDEPVPPPHEINPELTRELEAVILRALEKRPSRRFRKVKDLEQALTRTIDAPSASRSVAEGESARRSRRPVRTLARAGLASLAAVLVGLVVLSSRTALRPPASLPESTTVVAMSVAPETPTEVVPVSVAEASPSAAPARPRPAPSQLERRHVILNNPRFQDVPNWMWLEDPVAQGRALLTKAESLPAEQELAVLRIAQAIDPTAEGATRIAVLESAFTAPLTGGRRARAVVKLTSTLFKGSRGADLLLASAERFASLTAGRLRMKVYLGVDGSEADMLRNLERRRRHAAILSHATVSAIVPEIAGLALPLVTSAPAEAAVVRAAMLRQFAPLFRAKNLELIAFVGGPEVRLYSTGLIEDFSALEAARTGFAASSGVGRLLALGNVARPIYTGQAGHIAAALQVGQLTALVATPAAASTYGWTKSLRYVSPRAWQEGPGAIVISSSLARGLPSQEEDALRKEFSVLAIELEQAWRRDADEILEDQLRSGIELLRPFPGEDRQLLLEATRALIEDDAGSRYSVEMLSAIESIRSEYSKAQGLS